MGTARKSAAPKLDQVLGQGRRAVQVRDQSEGHHLLQRQRPDVDRTTTTEIKDIGTTKVVIPDEAMKKMS